MVSLKKQKGFTLVELLIVIIIIGILATLVIVTFTGVQAKARDSQRVTDIGAMDSQIEAYYATTGHYPSYADLTSATFISANLKGLDTQSLIDPKLATTTALGTALVNTSGDATHYGYEVFQSDGTTACETDDTTCATFTLTAHLEAGGTFTKKSST